MAGQQQFVGLLALVVSLTVTVAGLIAYHHWWAPRTQIVVVDFQGLSKAWIRQQAQASGGADAAETARQIAAFHTRLYEAAKAVAREHGVVVMPYGAVMAGEAADLTEEVRRRAQAASARGPQR